MDIEYLREFLAIARNERMSDAADELYTTSSSLSKHMQALEKELGVTLFKKVKRCLVPNAYGEALIPYAKEIVRQREALETILNEKRVTENSTLNVVSHYRIFEEVMQFRKDTGTNVIINESARGVELLENGDCEVGFLSRPESVDDQMEIAPYRRERMVFICNKNHPLHEYRSVAIEHLADESFVMFPKSDQGPLARKVYERFDQAGIKPRIAITATVGSTIAKLVAEDAGVAILWEKALRPLMKDIQGDISVIPLEPVEEIEIDICWMKNRILSDNARKFIAFMKERADLK